MMKWPIFFLLISFNSFATEICEDDNLTSFAKKLSVPNCFNTTSIDSLMLKDITPLCSECKPKFETLYNEKIKENIPELQKDFLEVSLNQYKKNLTNNLLSSVKLKTLFKTNGTFNQAIKSCKMKTNKDLLANCKSDAAKKLLQDNKFFENLSNELSNDLARFLSTKEDFKTSETLLSRTDTQCFIPERDILFFSTLSIEEALDQNLISLIQKIDPKNYDSVNEIFNSEEIVENYEGDISSLKQNLFNHPLLAPHLKSSEQFVNFIKKISSPGHLENLRKALYSSENAKSFDTELATSCEKSFKVLKDNICSDEFQKGQIYNDYIGNFSKTSLSKVLPDKQETASTEELVDNNLKLLATCENKDAKGKRNLTSVSSAVGISLTSVESDLPLDTFRAEKYNNEIGNLTNSLCKMTDDTCKEGTITCSIYKKYQESKKPGTLQNKLAQTSNSEVNELLRSMIGTPRNLDPRTKEILVLNGILPKEDGTMVAQVEIPERQPQVYTQQDTTVNPATVLASANARPSRPSPSAPARAPASSNGYSNSAPPTASNLDNLSDIFKENNDDLKDIQDEIRRRLLDMPEDRPVTKEQARKIASDVSRNKGRNLNPDQTEALAERIMNERPIDTSSPSSFQQEFGTSEGNRARVSDSETQLEKWKSGQKDAALMGMAGAQQVLANETGSSQANDAAPKELTKVALNISEDPKVNLSDIFNRKINQNDPETQLLKVLLKNKNNFLLQIKGTNFKIVFDGKSSFNLLFDSGDKSQAERIRPQLEMFLKKLKV
ncbi:MAG: hypothetical protein ACLGHN_01200 [Bacteriovoracia bacterium]